MTSRGPFQPQPLCDPADKALIPAFNQKNHNQTHGQRLYRAAHHPSQSSLGFAAARGAQCGISERATALCLRTQPVALNSKEFF